MDKITPSQILQAALGLILFVILALMFALILLTLPARFIVSVLARKFQPGLDEFVTGMSASMSKLPSMNVIFLLYIDGAVSTERGRFLFQNEVLSQRRSNGQLLYKKLKQTWTNYCGYTFWKTDGNFNLENHVRDYDYEGDLHLPIHCTKEDTRGVMSDLLDAPWVKGRSPWEAFFIPVSEDCDNPRTLFILRIHHALGDGYSIAGLLKTLAQTELGIPKPKAFFGEKFGFGSILRVPYDFAGLIMDSWDFQSSWHFSRKGKSRDCQISIFKSLPVSLIKQAKDKLQVSYAAVLYAVVGGGIQRIFEDANLPVPDFLTTHFPIPRANHPGGLTNHLNSYIFKWPIKADSTAQRAERINEKFNQLSKSLTTGLMFHIMKFISWMPFSLQEALTNVVLSGSSVLSTSFPVIENQSYFDGNPNRFLCIVVGAPGDSIGTTTIMAGINGEQGFGLNIDKRIFPSKEIFRRFEDYVEKELQNLL